MELSVITINLNNATGLLKTMRSVLSQTFNDFEYIIVDGESSDNSVDLIKEFNTKFQNLYWISEPDSGIFNAMNKGINLSKGKYLLFLNSGDFLSDQNTLEQVFSNKRNADILCGKANIIENGILAIAKRNDRINQMKQYSQR